MSRLPPITVLTARQRDTLTVMRQLHATTETGEITLVAIGEKMGVSRVVVWEYMKSLEKHGFVFAISTCSTMARHKYIPVMEQPLEKIVTTAIATLCSHGDLQIANELETAFGGYNASKH